MEDNTTIVEETQKSSEQSTTHDNSTDVNMYISIRNFMLNNHEIDIR